MGAADRANIIELTEDVRKKVFGSDDRSDGILVKAAAQCWRAVLILGILVLLYWPVLTGLADDWLNNPDYSHGVFVPLLSAYLVWRNKKDLLKIARRPSLHGLLIVLASLGLLFLGSLGAELFLTRVALLGSIAGLIVYFWGWKVLRAIAFPMAFLLMMIPLPALIYNELVFPLQLLASRLASALLDLLNFFPVVREGNILVLPHSRLEVVEACSGIRSLMSLVTLALAYGYLLERKHWIRIVLLVTVVPIAVVSNGIRVVITALLTYYAGPKIADGFMHSFSGWLIFMLSTALLLSLHTALKSIRQVGQGAL